MRILLLILHACIFHIIVIAQAPPGNENKKDTSILAADSILTAELDNNVSDNIPVVSLDESEFSEAGTQNISSLLTAGREPFYTAAAYYFSPLRFKIRGYDADLSYYLHKRHTCLQY
jgi:hypothetical protein